MAARQVFCNGEEVLTTSGTQEKYTVDVWSGNHPFFQGAANTVLMDEGSVNRFKRRYGGLDSMSDMSRIKTGIGMLCLESGALLDLASCAMTTLLHEPWAPPYELIVKSL